LGDITSLEWPLWLQAADNDLLSLGLDDSFSELYLVCFIPTCVMRQLI